MNPNAKHNKFIHKFLVYGPMTVGLLRETCIFFSAVITNVRNGNHDGKYVHGHRIKAQQGYQIYTRDTQSEPNSFDRFRYIFKVEWSDR
jgi:hypothetical protein